MPPVAPAQGTPAPNPADTESSWHCWGCGYDLHGLPVEGVCPECGRSKDLSPRRFPHAKSLANALNLLGISYLLMLGAMCVLPWIVAVVLRLIAAALLNDRSLLGGMPQVRRHARLLRGVSIAQLLAICLAVTIWAGVPMGSDIMIIAGVLATVLELGSGVLIFQIANAIANRLELPRWVASVRSLVVTTMIAATALVIVGVAIPYSDAPVTMWCSCLGVVWAPLLLVLIAASILDTAGELRLQRATNRETADDHK